MHDANNRIGENDSSLPAAGALRAGLSRRGLRQERATSARHRAPRRIVKAPRWVSILLAPVLVLTGVTGSVLLTATAANADTFTPTVSISNANEGVRATEFVLAGEDAHYDLSVRNDSPDQKFNVSVTALVPADVSFVSASYLGTPTVYTQGQALPNATRTTVPDAASCDPLVPAGAPSLLCAVPTGFQLWVWQNVADLPSNAQIDSSLVVRPNAASYSVGSDALSVDLTAYTSDDPIYLPTFDGSTSVSTSSSHTSQPGEAARQTEVNALRVAKSEIESPENELLRGIHTQTTTYELQVEYSGEAPTDSVTVVDYLPAGLEYLGAGGSDNTAASDTLYDGNREYPTAPDLTGTPSPSGGTGDWNGSGELVETVELTASEATALGLDGAGVYTKVTWNLGTLAGGTPQVYPATEGATGTYVIRYRAAVPLFENTMTWQVGSDADAPTPAGDTAQGSNLNNNNGPSTRHGIGDPDFNDGQSLTNAVTASGTYSGQVVDDPTDRAAFDRTTETVTAMDLRVVKAVNPNDFLTGDYATYTLTLDTSEYTSSAGIELTDDVANGVCPAIPTQSATPTLTINGVPTDVSTWNAAVSAGGSAGCAYPNDSRTLTGASVTAIDFEPGTGAFVTEFVTADMPADSTTTIEYQALQRPTYITTPGENGATSSGDTMVNIVDVRGTTTAIDPIENALVHSTEGVAYGVETVGDDSQAEIVSNFSALSKTVLERDLTLGTASPADWVDHAADPFAIGDTVWYRIRIDFADGIETRNPLLTDYLPQGVDYTDLLYSYDLSGVGSGTLESVPLSGAAADFLPAPTLSGGDRVLTWQFGDETYPDSPDRFIPEGSWVEIYVQGEVVGQSASSSVVDIPQNQAKYQQENVDREIFFLRDDAQIDLDWPAAPLIKGVRDVNDLPAAGNAFNSNVGTAGSPVQVVQDDIVTYRVDVTTPHADTADFVVWDALPEGVTSASNFAAYAVEKVGAAAAVETPIPGSDVTATVYAPGTLANVDPAYAGRTIVVWDLSAVIAGSDPDADTVRGFSLQYDIVVPTDAEVTQTFTNTASIVSYALQNNNGGTTTVLPDGPISTTPAGPGEYPISGDDTYDDAVTRLPAPSMTKALVSTDIAHTGTTPADPNNRGESAGSNLGQIVQGEVATFRYTATVPAHTTIAGGELSDDGLFRWTGSPTPPNNRQVAYELIPGSPAATFDGSSALPTGFTLDADGTLHFPASYQNATSSAQVFAVTIEVWVRDADASTPGYTPNFPNGKTLTNTARFAYTNPNTGSPATALSATANVSYIEPSPTLAKSHTPTGQSFAGGDVVEYTLTASNASGRPILYDATVVDCVPAELTSVTVVGGSPSAGSVTITTAGPADPDGCADGSTKIVWTGFDLEAGAAGQETLRYTATVTPTAAAGDSYTNDAELTGYTLPSTYSNAAGRGDRADTASDTIEIDQAGIVKSVVPGSAPIGDTVTYTVTTTLPADVTFYDAEITDALPEGIEFDAMTSTTCETASSGPCGFTVPASPTVTGAVATGQTLTWALGDVAAATEDRTITQVYTAVLTDDVAAAAPTNTAAFGWDRVDGDPSTRESVDDTAAVTILNPALSIDKAVSNAAPNPGEVFDYTVEVTNSGNTAAYNITVTDDVDPGIVVDTTSISPVPTSIDAGVGTGAGGTITWNLTGPLSSTAPGNTLQFTYSATLADSPLISDQDYDNVAAVTAYESFPTGGREYGPETPDTATVNPPFPAVELAKTVTSTEVAYANTPFSWTITATNNGDGPAQTVELTDTLPVNWEMDAVTSVTVGGSAWAGTLTPTVTGTGDAGDPQQLVWSFGSASPAAPVLAPGQSIVIVFTAIPRTAALTDAGVTDPGPPVVRPPHTNTLTAVTTDTSGATENADGSYTGPDGTADAFIHRADLHLVKEAIGGDTTTGDWVPGAAVGADYTQPQWQITVTNQGPDASVGPFSVVDTTTLPTGVTTGSFTARYYASSGDTTGTPLPLAGTGTGADPFVVGDGSTSLKADGTDRIALVADVTIAASAVGDAENEASVVGVTYETPGDIAKDNADDVSKPLTPLADLVMDKSASSPVNAGGSVTWTLTVTNDGPSDSVSTSANPITVTDTIPNGMQGTTFGTLPVGWTASAPGPFAAGQTVTFTLADGERLTASQVTAFTLTGTIDPSWPASTGIPNTGTVTPGETTDPDPSNNDDTETVTPGIDTTLGINKTRVVFDGSAWVPATAANPVVPGEPVTYLVEVTNTGTADARDVTVDDEVAEYFTYQSLDAVSGTWTRTTGTAAPGDDQTFALTGDLAAGGSASFRVTLLLDPAHETGAIVANTVVAHATNSTNDPDDTDSTSDSQRSADLSIAKSHSGTVHAGDPLEYTVTVTNNGPSASSGPIEITDTLPAGFGYQSASATVSVAGGAATATEPVVSGQTLTWTVGNASSSLANGATIVIVFSATTDADLTAGSYTNEADVDGPDDDNPSNNHADDPTTVDTLTNLVITKTPDAGPYVAGTDVGYTLTIDNEGPSVARSVVVTDATPAGMTVTAMSGSGWSCDVTVTPAECEIADLPVGTTTISVTAALSASVPDGTDLTNTATVSTSTPETTTTDNTDDATIRVDARADLGIVKTAVDDAGDPVTTAIAGNEARYLLEVHNYGPSDAAAPVTIVDTLPEGITFVGLVDGANWSAVADPVDPVSGTQTVTLTRVPSSAGLATGTDAPAVTLVVQLDPSIPVDPVTGLATLTNSATVSSGTTEPAPDPHPNTDTADLDVTQAVNLSIVKTHDAGDVRIGDDLPFDLAVRNDGPSTATGVSVVDTIPAGLDYVDAAGSDPAWTVVASPVAPDGTTTVTATLAGDLAPATDAPTLSLTVTVTAAAYDEVVNVGVVSADQPETDPSDNTSDDTVRVPPQSTLVVTKHLSGALQVGSNGTYVITVTNDGPTEDPGPIVVTDVLPRGLSYVSASGTGATCGASGQTVTCTLTDPLGVAETVSLRLVVKVATAAYPEVTNTVTIATPTEQLPGSVPTASTTDPVAADPLAGTGGALPWWMIMAALLLMIAGGGFFAASRRRVES